MFTAERGEEERLARDKQRSTEFKRDATGATAERMEGVYANFHLAIMKMNEQNGNRDLWRRLSPCYKRERFMCDWN